MANEATKFTINGVQHDVMDVGARQLIASVQAALNAITSGDTTTAIKTFQEVIDFLDGVTDDATLVGKLNELRTLINGKYAKPANGIPSSDLVQSVQDILSDVANKVNKETGKGLSTNDYTTEDKSKLGNLPTADQLTQQMNSKANSSEVVKSISVNGGTAQTPTNGNVNVVVPTVALDDVPTAGSDNGVKSGGVKTALDNLLANLHIVNGEWYIGNTATGVSAQGPAGNVNITDASQLVTILVNDLTTGGAGNILTAEMGKVLNDRLLEVCGGISYEDKEVITVEAVEFTKGKYINTGKDYNDGVPCSLTEAAYEGTDYAVVNLEAGDKLDIKGVGGGDNGGRLWAILDPTTHAITSIAAPTPSTDLPIPAPLTETIVATTGCIVVIVVYNDKLNQNYGNQLGEAYSATLTKTRTIHEGTPVDGILGGMQEDIEELQGAIGQESSYNGMKLAALGDSITWGYTPRNSGGTAGSQLDSFAKLAAQKLGMTFSNHGVSGSTVSVISGQNRNPMCQRYNDLPNDADVITFMGGVNDVSYNATLGTMADRGTDTFYGALHTIMQGLYTKYIGGVAKATGKKKKIIICTPIKSLDASKLTKTNSIANNADVLLQWDEWIEAIREVAAFYSFPVLDMYNLSSINPHLDRTVTGTTSWGATGHFNPYITDGVHPTQEGAEMMADLLVGFLKGLK